MRNNSTDHARKKLSADFVKALTPREKAYELRDTDLRGLIVRVQPTGLRIFYLQYRNAQGKTARLKLGRFPVCTVAMARSKAAEELAKVILGADPAAEKRTEDEPDPETITLRQFIEGPYKEWAQTPGNLKSERATLARLKSGFAPLLDLPLRDIDIEAIDQHKTWRLANIVPNARKKPTPQTCNRDVAHLRAALSKAVDWKLLPANPLKGIKMTRENKSATIRALTPEEEKAILAVFDSRRAMLAAQWKKKKHRMPHFESALEVLFLLSLDTGLRMGESRTLLWTDIDLKAPTVTVRGAVAKSSQSRVVPLSTRVVAALTAWGEQTGTTGKLFTGATEPWLVNAWRTVCRRSEVTGVRWHDLRHTFGSRCARAGVPIMTIKALMGHASITTTQRYLHSTADDARAAIAMLEAGR
jgi:integrase